MKCMLSGFQCLQETSVTPVTSRALCSAQKCITVPKGIEVKTSSFFVLAKQFHLPGLHKFGYVWILLYGTTWS